jgi:hypothetical protein
MLHRKEYLTSPIGNLCHGRYLPIEVLAVDDYGEGAHRGPHMRIDLHIGAKVKELEIGPVEPEALPHVRKL